MELHGASLLIPHRLRHGRSDPHRQVMARVGLSSPIVHGKVKLEP